MGQRLFAGVFLALALFMGWHEVAVPLAAMRHGVEAVPLRTLRIVMVPVGLGIFGTWFWLGRRMEGLLQDDAGHARIAPGVGVLALLAVGVALRAWMGAHAHGTGYAEPPRHESFTLQIPATVQFGADQIVFKGENGQTYTMAWREVTSIGLVGGSKDFTPEIETRWQFDDARGMRGTVPQAAITEEALVAAARSRLPGNKVRADAVARFEAELKAPINAPAVAKGYAQFAEWVYLR